MDRRPIGVFDSGIGGLSVLQELYELLPREDYVFFADQKNVPYGEKTKDELIQFTSGIMDFLTGKKVKLVVAACNTATCYALDTLREKYDVPIVGVVPAIKTAAETTKTGNVGLIATPATAKSEYVTELISRHAGGKNVIRVGCFGLENAVETGQLKSAETRAVLEKFVAPLAKENIDQLVLGCTHYPFLKEEIGNILGPSIALVDSGKAVARRAEAVLNERGMRNAEGSGTTEFFTNKDAEMFSHVASQLLGRTIAGTYVA